MFGLEARTRIAGSGIVPGMSDREPSVRVETFVRASSAAVFHAFTNADRLAAFWLASASGPLTLGARVHWEFQVPGAEDDVECTVFEPGRRLAVKSSDGSTIAWELTEKTIEDVAGTVVRVTQTGLAGSPEAKWAMALEATQGFTYVLSDLKILLEDGASGGIVRDKAMLIAAG